MLKQSSTNENKAKNLLMRDYENKTISHAYLLCGDDENELRNISHEFALRLTDGSRIDINEFPKEASKDGEEKILVADIDALNSSITLKPVESEKKVYIINKAESMNVQSQNKLLKTLEEPPQNNVIILNCQSISTILKTIQSRCKTIHLNAVKILQSDDEQKDYCKNILLGLVSSKTILPKSHAMLEKKESLKEMLICFEEIFGELLTSGDEELKKMYSKNAILEILPKIRHAKERHKNNGNPTSIVDEILFNITQLRVKFAN
ncbi:MAG: DNA polymerase III subunit [Firmicutes bacterium]|nr:DNA polymerase III subunit [Bacillota bacterium]